MIYDIIWRQEIVGRAFLERKGLYYKISCRDCVPDGHRIEMCCAGKRVNLGICMPIDKEFGFSLHIPVKRAGEGPFEFYVVLVDTNDRFIPIKSTAPFPQISQLKDAYLCSQGDEIGLMLKDGLKGR